MLGHSSMQMVMRYSHLAPSHLEGVVRSFDTDLAQEKGVAREGSACATAGETTTIEEGETPEDDEVDEEKASEFSVVPPERLELSTSRLPSECSTSELRRLAQSVPKCATRPAPASLTKDT